MIKRKATVLALVALAVVAIGSGSLWGSESFRIRQVIEVLSPDHQCRTVVSYSDTRNEAGSILTTEWICEPRQSTAFLGTELVREADTIVAVDRNGYQCRGVCGAK